MSIKRKLLLVGLIIIVVQGLTTIGLAIVTGTRTNETAKRLADEALTRELDATLGPAVNLLQAQNESLLSRLDAGIGLARRQLATRRPSERTVDEIASLTGLQATVLQRTSDGDMVRVATTMLDEAGERMQGTTVAATRADGTADPMVAALLEGNAWQGRTKVGGRWYLRSFEPQRDARGEVVGAFGVSVAHEGLRAVRQALMDIPVGKTGYVFVLRGSGADRGQYIVSLNGTRDGENLIEARDADDQPFIRKLVDTATRLGPGEHTTMFYTWKNPGEDTARTKLARAAYVPEWDWIVAASAYHEDFMEAHHTLDRGLTSMLVSFGIATLVIGVLGAGLLLFFARGLTERLQRFLHAFGQLAQGDLTAHVEDGGRDEIGQLAEKLTETVDGLATIMGRMRGSADMVARGAQAIASGSDALNRRTQEQAASLQETSATMTEIAALVDTNADHAEHARDDAVRTAKLASTGREVVQQAVDAMDQVTQSSSRIKDMVELVDDISFQTNLLSLNAAVEAARVGEQGRGFAVVAEQVRRLAARSAEAAKEIRTLIATSHRQIDATNRYVSASGETLAEIVAASQTVAESVAEIAAASREQSNGVAEINRAILQMDRVTHDNSALVEESTDSAERLSGEAADLTHLAQRFQLDPGVREQSDEAEPV